MTGWARADGAWYLTVVAALAVGAHGVPLQGARGGVAAGIHAFLGTKDISLSSFH